MELNEQIIDGAEVVSNEGRDDYCFRIKRLERKDYLVSAFKNFVLVEEAHATDIQIATMIFENYKEKYS